MIRLSEIEKLILEEVQLDIPLEKRPFKIIADKTGLTEKVVISQIISLKKKGFIRDISAIYNAEGLGYKSTLVAVSAEDPDKTAAVISRHPGVSHNYFREHNFNIWFTLTIPGKLNFENIIDTILIGEHYNNYRILPSLKTFKIGVNFRFTGENKKKGKSVYRSGIKSVNINKDLIKILQNPFPIIQNPWTEIALKLEKNENDLFDEIRELKKSGIIKRISGVLRHRKAGYGANGMACFQIESNKVEAAGAIISEFNAVSHCYQRPVYPDWPYSIFAMTHGKSKEQCDSLIKEITSEIGAEKSLTLYSTKEYKKERIKYFIEND